MKFILVELIYELNNLITVKLSTVRKLKKKYYLDNLFNVTYNDEYLNDIIVKLVKKVELDKCPIIVYYHYDTISFLNISLPKMNYAEMMKNIDAEINKFVFDYKEKYDYVITKNSFNRENKYRVVLKNKLNDKEIIKKELLKDIRPKKIKTIDNYQVCERIINKYKYRNNINYALTYFMKDKLIINILNNGKVIERFQLKIDENLLEEYNLSHRYDDILNINNQYFKSVCEYINSFFENRSVDTTVLYFNSLYSEYLKNLIISEIGITHYVEDYEEHILFVLEEYLNE